MELGDKVKEEWDKHGEKNTKHPKKKKYKEKNTCNQTYMNTEQSSNCLISPNTFNEDWLMSVMFSFTYAKMGKAHHLPQGT